MRLATNIPATLARMNCKLCQRDVREGIQPATVATGVCETCRTTLGIVEIPPSRRRAKPCAHCNELRFVRVVPREFTATGGDYVSSHAKPMTATIVPATTPNLIFKGRTVNTPDLANGRGRLEMYICSTCGLVEWHCLDPQSIPIGPEYMTEEVDYSRSEPYR